MEINSINTSPNFGARIVIHKTGFKNLGEDLFDSFELSSLSGGSTGSATTETTIFPCDMVKGGKFANYVSKCINTMKETLERIFDRNIKTTTLEGVDTKAVAQKTASASTGSGIMSTGIGSYDFAVGSALDQSVNYPNSVFSPKFPEFSANHFPESVNKHLDAMERSAYNHLWDPRKGCGNECASSSVPTYVGIGSASQFSGFGMITKGKEFFVESGSRKLPS